MTLFSKIKAVRDLRSQAKEMQSILKDVHVETEHKGSKIALNGNLEVESLTLNHERSASELQNDLKDLLNDALKKTQRKMAEKMKESGKMNLPGLT
ncbi:MAG: YbaB/EbfC family nucleoid-associated protein [Patescibacteria group bacterium]